MVVGVDGTAESDAALAFALDEAARSGDSVKVVTVWHPTTPALSYPVVPMGSPRGPRDHAPLRRDAPARCPGAGGGPADVQVSTQVVEGTPGPALVQAATTARLLVVGSRALGSVRAALLGSVSRYCAHHAAGPVVVVPVARQSHEHETQALEPPAVTAP